MEPTMREKRTTKWDWSPHWLKMLELYNSGYSIPYIYRAIQCEGFGPSQRAVYGKFREAGYPTHHGRRLFQPQTSAIDTSSLNEFIVARMLEDTLPIECDQETSAPKLSGAQSAVTPPQDLAQDCMDGVQLPVRLRRQDVPGYPQIARSFEASKHMQTIPINDAKFITEDVIDYSTSPPPNRMLKRGTRQDPVRKKDEISETEALIIKNLQNAGLIDKPRCEHSGGRTKHPYPTKETDYETFLKRSNQSTSPTHARPIKKLCSLFKRTSLVADNDSGYCTLASSSTRSSGRDSFMFPQSPRLPEMLNSELSADFEGPYRVACKSHEYGLPSLYRMMQPCRVCGFSKVHNLAISASRLMLHEFENEIKLMNIFDLQALDAARNTALHYAAASGASLSHLKALIDAGVPLYQRNTANQTFLHSMRPSKARSQSYSPDCFEIGLINILRLVNQKLEFDQQDNNGQTVLQALALHITEPVCREKTFEICKESGSSLQILNRFGQSAKDIRPSDYKYPQTLTASSTFRTVGTTTPDLENSTSEWERDRCKQQRAYATIIEAFNDINYVDRITKDGVLHALSRVDIEDQEAVAQGIDIMQYLMHFVSRGVNLNHHNRDGDHPLSAFICNKDQRREEQGNETGPTTAKFLEVLLWKTSKRGTSNDLNDINVDMMNRRGATALYEAAIRAQPESVRSLIEAGANVNARLNDDPNGPSILRATLQEFDLAKQYGEGLREHELKKVISHLKHAKAALEPTSMQQRGFSWSV